MPPPWIPGRNKGKTKANKLVSRKVEEQNIHFLVQQVLLYKCLPCARYDTVLDSGNTTCGPCSQEAGKEKHLNKYLHKVY